MANSALQRAITDVTRKVDDQLGLLVDVSLERLTEEKSDDTGERMFAAAVNVSAKVERITNLSIDSERRTVVGRHRLTLYGEQADAGDRVTWGGKAHTVVAVMGLVADDTTGDVYSTTVLAD